MEAVSAIPSDPVLQTSEAGYLTLGRGTIDRIEDDTYELLLAAQDAIEPSIPVDPLKVAGSLGLTVKQGEFPSPELIGHFERPTNTIYVSESLSYSRKAFTIAHEIGHAVLHKGVIDKENFYRESEMDPASDTKEQEQEANWFAASLLMPKKQVERSWGLFRDVSAMAGLFGVSLSAMDFRLKNLKLT